MFLAVRGAALDLPVSSVKKSGDGTVHFYAGEVPPGQISFPLPKNVKEDELMRNMVLSFGAGGDVLTFAIPDLLKKSRW